MTKENFFRLKKTPNTADTCITFLYFKKLLQGNVLPHKINLIFVWP